MNICTCLLRVVLVFYILIVELGMALHCLSNSVANTVLKLSSMSKSQSSSSLYLFRHKSQPLRFASYSQYFEVVFNNPCYANQAVYKHVLDLALSTYFKRSEIHLPTTKHLFSNTYRQRNLGSFSPWYSWLAARFHSHWYHDHGYLSC